MQRTKPFFAQFAVWLVLFQLLTPIAFAGFDITTICSSDGIKQIAMDSQGNPVELPATQNHCELCILYSPNAPITQADSDAHLTTGANTHYAISAEAIYHYNAASLGFSSRAPPVYS